jgi:hypothetical protein
MQPEMMAGGLATVAIVETVIDVVQADPPVERDLRFAPFAPTVAFDGGAMALVTRHPDIVRLYLATEAGRISIIDLDPRDAAEAGAIIAGVDLEDLEKILETA